MLAQSMDCFTAAAALHILALWADCRFLPSWRSVTALRISRADLEKILKVLKVELSFKPLTKDHWEDFVTLFGERGACGGCWCMFWRLTRKQFESQKDEGNRKAMKALVDSGEAPGILAYHHDRAVGWCAVSPRSSYPALARSRVLKPVDDRPCWSIACLFIEKSYRKKGVATQLVQAAVRYARQQGAVLVEGYPVEPKADKDIPPAFAWTGIPKFFIRAGFTEVERRSPTRPIMRIELSSNNAANFA